MNQQSQREMVYQQVEQLAFNSAELDRLVNGTTDNDVLIIGDGGHTLVRAREGDDQVVCGNGNDLIRGGAGDDIIEAGPGDDVVVGDDGNDVIWGEEGNDFILGYAGSDRLYGGEGSDILEGGSGNDLLKGGEGNDMLCGGSGDDGYVFSCGDGIDSIVATEWMRSREGNDHDKVLFTDIEVDALTSVTLTDGRAGAQNLVVCYGDGDVLTIVAQNHGGSAFIDSFRFASGIEISTTALLKKYAGPGGSLAEPQVVQALSDFQRTALPSALSSEPLQQIQVDACLLCAADSLMNGVRQTHVGQTDGLQQSGSAS